MILLNVYSTQKILIMLTQSEITKLENQSEEEKELAVERATANIKTFLNTKYKGMFQVSHSHDVYWHLMDGDTDFGLQIWTIKNTCQNMLRVLSEESVRKLDYLSHTEAADVFVRLIKFCDALKEESSEALLDLAYINDQGATEPAVISSIEKTYADKLKVTEYKRSHKLDPHTRYEMGLEPINNRDIAA